MCCFGVAPLYDARFEVRGIRYGSAAFILGAIRALSGPFVFPANNIALVIGSAIIGVTVWGEHLTRVNWLGLGLAATALVLLNF